VLTLRGRFAWAHDFDPDRAIAATPALPGASFVVNGGSIGTPTPKADTDPLRFCDIPALG
jgi:uncharacterized protein with beta-barrel porin domain